jgi:hypothetical protein
MMFVLCFDKCSYFSPSQDLDSSAFFDDVNMETITKQQSGPLPAKPLLVRPAFKNVHIESSDEEEEEDDEVNYIIAYVK